MAATALLEAGLARVLFYPTLLYTLFRGKVPGRAHRDWYHRIDPTVLLGALPLRSLTRQVSRAGEPGPLPRPRRSVPVGPLGSPPSLLNHLFASAAGPGRERARGDHHERGVRDEVPVQLFTGAQMESRGGCKSHRQDPVIHPHQAWPAGCS
ncbi:phosphatidylglycerophosphatase and protein-tyrosine phosphatase 1 isoform X2 [Symphalangus syndactylus]|uniref:phosphatidylglycerophosphatase and protein-tyrosine phosphatase 1 isoform X2 n=1 Tax=Symphalangus syndactylus TaxID=9590 RepID=UPI0024430C26|nr:phosphatidylglycerophosphatase and protein-tyrosine phosphatase 1 isoform X2 [Symphalangus syndactylus]